MPHLVPPMDSQPPADYVQFVVGSIAALRDETVHMVGERHADRIYPEALSDLARHWRRLSRQRRSGGPDPATVFLRRRLCARVAQWQEDNAYAVDVEAVPHAQSRAARSPAAPPDSVARQMAALLPPTQRSGLQQVAEAEIAWVHAYRRYHWTRVGRHVAGVVLVVGGIVHVMSRLSGAGP